MLNAINECLAILSLKVKNLMQHLSFQPSLALSVKAESEALLHPKSNAENRELVGAAPGLSESAIASSLGMRGYGDDPYTV